jgi:hypothetical protein
MLPAGRRLFRRRRCKTVQEKVHHHVSKFLRLDVAFGIVPSVAEVEHAKQHHSVDLFRALDDLALRIESDQQIRDGVDQLPLQRLYGLLMTPVGATAFCACSTAASCAGLSP